MILLFGGNKPIYILLTAEGVKWLMLNYSSIYKNLLFKTLYL